jgi:hypothetical protein
VPHLRFPEGSSQVYFNALSYQDTYVRPSAIRPGQGLYVPKGELPAPASHKTFLAAPWSPSTGRDDRPLEGGVSQEFSIRSTA